MCAACVQTRTRRVCEGEDWVDVHRLLRQPAVYRPHRKQAGNSRSTGWGVQGILVTRWITSSGLKKH